LTPQRLRRFVKNFVVWSVGQQPAAPRTTQQRESHCR